ncbi:DUF262 domain-containing protein [Actinomadura madurae]|uniref:DUF262 domain-containing protein n=1 Tax=Actinomadura madurae TaxID=1993 RepID=UPI000D92C252|nr:DUF262 domain-containing protein [Actinomadura madurae]SPT60103.1 Uncharacterized conserved protein [Actinomadura madurae]
MEYDHRGQSIGVEAEQAQDEPGHEPFDPSEIQGQTRQVTVGELVDRIRRGLLDLEPGFQRLTGVWSEGTQSRLIESLLLRIPLPALLAAEKRDQGWVIVDGVQRLTTIIRFVAPELIGAERLRLRGLEYLHDFEGYDYGELPGGLRTRIDESALIVYLMRAGTPDVVTYNVFSRINTGGRPLTRQELRNALISGPARDLLEELAGRESFLDATLHSVKPDRMADRELVLRFLAFRLTEPSDYPGGDFDLFLRQAMERLNTLESQEIERLRSDFDRAMRAASDIFGRYAFRKRFAGQERRYPINKALFEAIAVNLADLSSGELAVLRERSEMVQERFLALMENSRFLQAISFATGDREKLRLRFGVIEELFREVVK